MGAHLRVALHRTDLKAFLETAQVPVIAATLEGKPVHEQAPLPAGILLLGNESRGLSADLLRYATLQCCIPRRGGAESLNVAVAGGILCDRLIPL
jgi:TrmH family RNA methyltransferase